MDDLLLAIALYAFSGAAGAASVRLPSLRHLPTLGCFAASGLLLAAVLPVLLGGGAEAIAVDWSVPFGTLSMGIDPLTAFFLLPVALATPLASLYGLGYMAKGLLARRAGAAAAFFNALAAGMALLLCSRNAVLMLAAWELMGIASFFLVATERERRRVAAAAWLYLAASHVGAALILASLLLLGRGQIFLDFSCLGLDYQAAPGMASAAFLAALAGFGMKAGLVPLHIWLPEAHPAAPSHVSAVMSGVMIKMGLYGFLRVAALLDNWPAWWAYAALAAGAATALYGAAMALAQADLKRLLAYSSVENMGIAFLGVGLGMLGVARGIPSMAVLGFSGAFLHVLNHSLFKSLLFLCAGAVSHSAGTLDLERLGGLAPRMRATAACFMAGAAAAAALPPFNGFAGEFLLYSAAWDGFSRKDEGFACAAAAASLALVGGLALAAFVKAFGAAFLGEPRAGLSSAARDGGPSMTLPLAVLAAACLLAGLASPAVAVATIAPMASLLPDPPPAEAIRSALDALAMVAACGCALAAAAATLLMARLALPRARPVLRGPTWDCGYAAPTPRMQYSASSFSDPLSRLFSPLGGVRSRDPRISGPLPAPASFSEEPQDLCQERMFIPAFVWLRRVFSRLLWIETKSIHLCVLYFLLATAALLVWRFIL